MKTISPRRRSRGEWWRPLVVGAVLVLLGGVLWYVRPLLEDMLWRVGTPLASVRFGVLQTANVWLGSLRDSASLSEENMRLKGELASTTSALADRVMLRARVAELESQLGRTDSAAHTVLAGVVMRPPATPYDTLLVDAGSTHGVAEGALVFEGSAAVGSVAQVYTTSSRVALFSSPGQILEGMLNGTVPVSVEGQGGGSLIAIVPVDTSVAVGDSVTISGIASPLALRVWGVERREGESFKTIYFRAPVNPFQTRFVTIAI